MTDLAHDYLDVDSLLTADERALRGRVRAFVDERIRPNIARWYETAHFPAEIAGEMGALGLLGMHLEGYGCAGRSAVEYGLAALELEAGDSASYRADVPHALINAGKSEAVLFLIVIYR